MRFIVATVFALGVFLYVVSAFSRTVTVRLKADTTYIHDVMGYALTGA